MTQSIPLPIPVQFEQFDSKHPQVYRLFKMFAIQLLNKGKKGGARLIIERIRWEITMQKFEEEEFKINNNYTPHYSRKLAKEDPRFADFFSFRELHNVVNDPGSEPLMDTGNPNG
jgi:hypothetical protein